eukprot:COSAG02_NODE_3590_length_6517_cov_2.757401_1_plen_114_part_10
MQQRQRAAVPKRPAAPPQQLPPPPAQPARTNPQLAQPLCSPLRTRQTRGARLSQRCASSAGYAGHIQSRGAAPPRAPRRCQGANVEHAPVCLACKIVKMTAEKPRRCERREGWR